MRRTEVLLQFGSPEERLQNDRFFVYTWHRIAGYWFVGGGYSGTGGPITRRHYLGLEFAGDGILRRFSHLEGVWEKDTRRQLEEWMAEP